MRNKNRAVLYITASFILIVVLIIVYRSVTRMAHYTNHRASYVSSASSPKPGRTGISVEILFTQRKTESSKTSLCVLNLKSGNTEVLLGPDTKAGRALGWEIGTSVFSPDGKKILLAASDAKSPVGRTVTYEMDEKLDLWIFDRESKVLRRLTDDRQGYWEPQWSPDGRYISAEGLKGYTSEPGPKTEAQLLQEEELYVWNVQTGRKYTVGPNRFDEKWRPDSKGILYITDDNEQYTLWTWDITGHKKIISQGVSTATWTQDSKAILFSKVNDKGIYYKLQEGKAALNLSHELYPTHFFPWSPDGLYALWTDNYNSLTLYNFALRKPQWTLLDTTGSDCKWSPDGKSIVINIIGTQLESVAVSLVSVADGKSRLLHKFSSSARLLGWADDNTLMLVHPWYWSLEDQKPARQKIIAVSTTFGTTAELASLPAGYLVSYQDWRLLGNPRRSTKSL